MVLLSQIRFIFFINGLKPMIGLSTQPFSVFSSHLEQVFCGNFGFLRFRLKAEAGADYLHPILYSLSSFSTLLTLTTTPLSLADGIESGLALKRLKVPVHEIGLMLDEFTFCTNPYG